jgi:hypothetical protein
MWNDRTPILKYREGYIIIILNYSEKRVVNIVRVDLLILIAIKLHKIHKNRRKVWLAWLLEYFNNRKSKY